MYLTWGRSWKPDLAGLGSNFFEMGFDGLRLTKLINSFREIRPSCNFSLMDPGKGKSKWKG